MAQIFNVSLCAQAYALSCNVPLMQCTRKDVLARHALSTCPVVSQTAVIWIVTQRSFLTTQITTARETSCPVTRHDLYVCDLCDAVYVNVKHTTFSL